MIGKGTDGDSDAISVAANRPYSICWGNTKVSVVARCGGCRCRAEAAPTGNPQWLSYETSYTDAMADTITFRPDEDTSKALEILTKDGTAVSAAVRSALIDAARKKAGAAIRAEAESLAEDESDRAEAMQVLRDMETLRAW